MRRKALEVQKNGKSRQAAKVDLEKKLPYQLKDAIPLLLYQVIALGSNVLCAFEEDCHAWKKGCFFMVFINGLY